MTDLELMREIQETKGYLEDLEMEMACRVEVAHNEANYIVRLREKFHFTWKQAEIMASLGLNDGEVALFAPEYYGQGPAGFKELPPYLLDRLEEYLP